jgi:hypothetical protein
MIKGLHPLDGSPRREEIRGEFALVLGARVMRSIDHSWRRKSSRNASSNVCPPANAPNERSVAFEQLLEGSDVVLAREAPQ